MEQRMQQPDWTKVTEVELVYKTKIKASERPVVTSPKSCYELLLNHWNALQMDLREEFKVIFLNRGNKVIGLYPLSAGGLTGTVADPRLILAAAIIAVATSIILVHNHPSGTLKPSAADTQLTQKIKEAAAFHDITVLDHMIISSEGYLSFADEGIL